jgi:hypothetical protein
MGEELHESNPTHFTSVKDRIQPISKSESSCKVYVLRTDQHEMTTRTQLAQNKRQDGRGQNQRNFKVRGSATLLWFFMHINAQHELIQRLISIHK